MEKLPAKPHDQYVKELLRHPDAAVEFLNHALPAEVCTLLDLQRLRYTETSYTSHELRELLNDVVLSVPLLYSDQDTEVTILIEHKSFKDRMTPFQLLSYVAAGYQKQMKYNKKLKLIIPVVYYHGKQKWQLPAFSGLFTDLPVPLQKYVPVLQVDMMSIRNMSREQILAVTNGKLRAALMVHKGAHERLFALEEYARVINMLYKENRGNFFISTIVYKFSVDYFNPQEFQTVTTHLDTPTKRKTMTLREHFIAEGIEKGIEKGIAVGIEKGKKEGIEKGKQEGSLQRGYEFARKLLQRNMPLEEICELTDLTMEEVKRIKV
jgi:predicted transposase/invertase (TIGR01784 family)